MSMKKRWRPDETPCRKLMPAHIEPAFKTGEELLAWQKRARLAAFRSAGARESRDENAAHLQPLGDPPAASELPP